MECVQCGVEFDPIRYRWLCPNCKMKNSCCEGAPLGEQYEPPSESDMIEASPIDHDGS